MFVILGSGLDRSAHIGFAGLAIGLTLGMEVAFISFITGASMNPAHCFGPALVAGIWQHHWIYWVAPILGSQFVVVVYGIIPNNFQDSQK
jgi:aquaporin Z